MTKNSFLDWSETASNNTDIGGIGTQGTNLVSNFDDAFRTLMAQARTGIYAKTETAEFSRGYIFGLSMLKNSGDATNDVDIAVGNAASDTSPYYMMVLTSAITKRIDASWAVGTGNGGLDTGAVGNNTYYIWLIQRSDTGVVDALFSLSSSAPTMPANYDRKRLLGRVIRSGGVNAGPISSTAYQGSLLGTVSQSGSVPTGSVFETGTGASDYYVKFANGTMICAAIIDITATAISTARGSLFGTAAALTWTYPAAFSVSPWVTGIFVRDDITYVGGVSTLATGTSATTYQPWLSTSLGAGNAKEIELTAVGKWF